MDEDLYIPGFTNDLASSFQSHPTEQPVQTAVFNEPSSASAMPSNYADTLRDAAMRAYTDAATRSFGATGELSPRLDRIDTSTDFNYSPTAAQQYWNVNQYLSNQPTGYDLSHMAIGATTDPRTGAVAPLTNTQVEQYAATPLENQFYANFNPGTENWASGTLQFDPNSQYQLIDRSTGDVLYSGTGYNAGQNITNLASGLMNESGNKANWSIQTAAPGSSDWTQRYEHVPDASGFEAWLKIALPLATGGIFGPMLPGALGVSAPVGAGLATAGGTAAAGVLSGDSLKNILLQSALSGLAAGGMSALTMPGANSSSLGNVSGGAGGVGGTGGGGVGSVGGSFAGTDALGNFITVPGRIASTIPGSLLGAALGAASGALSGANYGDRVWGDQTTNSDSGNEIVVKGTLPSGPSYTPGIPAGVVLDVNGIPEGFGPDIVVQAPKENVVKPPPAALPDLFSPLNSVDIPPLAGTQLPDVPPVDDNEIVVNAPPRAPDLLPVFYPPINSVDIPANAGDVKPTDGKTDIEKLIEKLRLGTTLLGSLGGLFGSGSTGGLPFARGPLNPIFSAKLPAPNLQQGTARPMTGTDWYRYGYGPEQSFYSHVPQGGLNSSTAYTGYEPGALARLRKLLGLSTEGYAKGGKVHETLSYEDLTPEEKNFVDYHRRNMAVNPLEQDGALTTVYGMIDPVDGGEMLHPGYVHGRIMDRGDATDWAKHSGIDFPVYPDAATALAREARIHRDIIEPDTERYQRGDRSWLDGYAEGGYAVGGAGDGREDKIPAMLSDGEYVMDAETVAMLGNGSSKAGADLLDKFRVNIRKHKGRELAKGKFSANAKKPEQYLKGRK